MFCDMQLTKQEMKKKRCYTSLCHVIQLLPGRESNIKRKSIFYVI